MPQDCRSDRKYWVQALHRIISPVLEAAAVGQLKQTMPVEAKPGVHDRHLYSHLEAVGRTLAGIAPWLTCPTLTGDEAALQRHYADLARRTIASITDPDSPDFLNYSVGEQPLVDAAFLAQGILRAPRELLEPLDPAVERNLANCMRSVRYHCKPYFSNWLLFAAMIEALMCRMGEEWDAVRIDYAFRQHEQWYVGDGMYGDGPQFRWDYYNSFVIQPMLIDVLDAVGDKYEDWRSMKPAMLERIRRYAVVQERLIGPDGSYPPLGRSITYRFGAFQALSQVALMHQLPDELPPAQVRSALTAVLRKFFDFPDMFDAAGWLRIGLYGHQPSLGERYISTGSLYLMTTGFLPLGLAPDDAFWSGSAMDWTQRQLQVGRDSVPDAALSD
ncbi:MAG: DUF2264 domain-containing protein [Alicyclobacillus sp.]|nr:DUF2264 domain-containing protein [Alicyclobacillus sp.]